MIHIICTQSWAGGHRCSLRHNVCHPATVLMRMYTIEDFIGVKKFLCGIFGDIFYTQHWLYVVITTKVKYDGATRTHAYTII